MGKATTYDERQASKYLTSSEIKRRKAATAISDEDVEATLDHTLVKRKQVEPRKRVEPPQEVFNPPESWD